MRNSLKLLFALTLSGAFDLSAQTLTGTQIDINHPTLGANGDATSFFRVDPSADFSSLRLRLGDEWTSNFSIGYNYYADGQWVSNFNLDGNGIGYFRANLGIGTTAPAAKLSFNNLNDGTNQADGITWYSPSPLVYGIYRTAGAWSAPNYQQLKLSFDTGIILDPGSVYSKSYVDIQGAGGLRVSSGKVGIGTTTPTTNLTVNGTGTVEANIATDGASTSRSILSFSRNTGTWNVGMNMNLANSDNFYFRYNGTYPFTIQSNGNVGIGTTNPNQKLTVNGTIYGKEVKVDLSVPGPDYVFDKDYQLASLEDIKTYIDQHKHLPEVPSAAAMEANGINLGEMNMILLKKVEELTLHLIEQEGRIELLNRKVKSLELPK